MSHYLFPKNDNKSLGGAIVGGAGQFVNAYKLCPPNQDTSYPSSSSQGSSSDSKSANSPPAFRPKGPIHTPVSAGQGKPKVKVKTTPPKPPATKPPPKT